VKEMLRSKKARIACLLSRYTFAAFCLGLLPAPLLAQAQPDQECNLELSNRIDAFQQVAIDNSWTGTFYNGGGGVDTFSWQGLGTFSPRPRRFKSLEIINTKTANLIQF